MKPLKYLCLALLLTACGGGGGNSSAIGGTVQKFGSQQLAVIGNASGLSITPGTIQGEGAVRFQTQFAQPRAGGSFALDFSLQDGGALTLVTHAGSSLDNGYEMEFRRRGSGTGSLKVTLRSQGVVKNTVNQFGQDVFSGMDASLPLKLQVDVHNDETPAHALVWSRLISDDFSLVAAILDTKDITEKSGGSPGFGTGTYWGLRLDQAVVTQAEPGPTKVDD